MVMMNLGLTSDSGFALPAISTTFPISPVSRYPQFFPIAPEYQIDNIYDVPVAKAAHQNFEGLLTRDSPARRGEIVHLYATGLGRVDDTGRIIQPLACSIPILNQSVDAPIQFAGYAPGIPGVYQVDLLIPPDLPTHESSPGLIEVICGTDSPKFALPIQPD